ncbi:MAG: phage head morphogenesis protein [Desulfovibrio sp.]|nr:phage head morphogenesis protein [Desulfovibrio sp.]
MTRDEALERYFVFRLMEWREKADAVSAQAIAQIVQTISRMRRDVAKALVAQLGSASDLTLALREHSEDLVQWTSSLLASVGEQTSSILVAAAASTAVASAAEHSSILSLGGKASAVQTVELGEAQLQAWLKTPLASSRTLRWVNRTFSVRVREAMRKSLFESAALAGKGTKGIVKDIVDAAASKGARLAVHDAVTIARTFVQQASNDALVAVYRRNRKIVRGRKWTSTLSNRTCIACAALDGRTYGWDDKAPNMPLHPRCRCVWTPVVRSWADMGLSGPLFDEAIRPWTIREPGYIEEGGKLKILNSGTAKGTFGGWFRTLPADVQDEIAGAARGKLLRSGAMKWEDIVDPATGIVRDVDWKLSGI